MIRRTPRVVVMIPARYDSSRYPGKPLVPLRGCTGEPKPLIRRSWEAAMRVEGVHEVYVVTDHDTIAETARGFGAQVVMTSADCRNGTERCAEALDRLGEVPDLVVNLQGDAPLTPAWFVEDLVAGLRADPDVDVATPVLRCSGAMRSDLIADRVAGRVGGTTAVFGHDRRALYFSKEVIPYAAADFGPSDPTPVFHHVGVYAYRPGPLAEYPGWGEGRLEMLEGLEQLRFLERGRRVLCVEVDAKGREFWELNNPSDVPKLEAMMSRMGIA